MLGSNINDPKLQLDEAIKRISKLGEVISKSSIYVTAAWGKTDQNDFFNQAIILTTKFQANELMEQLLQVEQSMGRIREQKWAERSIDIDIILIDNKIINSDNLNVPHPYMHQRRFVLEPCNEIAKEWTHPIFMKTISDLLLECQDTLRVQKNI